MRSYSTLWLPGCLLVPVVAFLLVGGWNTGPAPAPHPDLTPRPRTPLTLPVEEPTAAPVATAPQPRPSPTPASSPLSVEERTPTPAPRPERIPGIESAALLSALESAGLRCTSPAVLRRGLGWTCSAQTTRGDYVVTLYGDRTDSIQQVSATVSQSDGPGSDMLAVMFLANLAGVPYQGSEPQRARQWVGANIGPGGTLAIGGVHFELSGAPGARTLDMVVPDVRR